MDLTPERKAHIDKMPYDQLLSAWRLAPWGDPWFQTETGDYWGQRMAELRRQPGGEDVHVAASKSVGPAAPNDARFPEPGEKDE